VRQAVGKFAQAAKTFNYSNTKMQAATADFAANLRQLESERQVNENEAQA
jgi:hypothetical protein